MIMEIKYYDIGLNLFCKQFSDPDRIIADAAADGVMCILTGSDMKENRLVSKYVKTHAAYGTAGIHPHNADSAKPADFDEIERIITENVRITAVGECGLDYDRMFSTKENQLNCLKEHIALAEKLGKPMFLHERDAAGDFIKCFTGHPDVCARSVVHCFTGDRTVLSRYLGMGFSIGVTGWICDDRRADQLRRAVKIIPLDRIMLETDAPYLTPRNVKGLGRTNVPQNIKYVAAELARHMGVSVEELTAAALANTERIFGIGR